MGFNKGSYRGGKTAGALAQNRAKQNLERYLKNPKMCLNCGATLIPREGRKLHSVTRISRRFCSKCKYHGKKLEQRKCLGCNILTSNPSFCSLTCQRENDFIKYIEQWKLGLVSGSQPKGNICRYVRRYILEKFGNKCSICGWQEYNPVTNRVPVEIEHIDGNWLNNNEDNLTLLCPNCHSLTTTFRGLNKGKGRAYRRVVDK